MSVTLRAVRFLPKTLLTPDAHVGDLENCCATIKAITKRDDDTLFKGTTSECQFHSLLQVLGRHVVAKVPDLEEEWNDLEEVNTCWPYVEGREQGLQQRLIQFLAKSLDLHGALPEKFRGIFETLALSHAIIKAKEIYTVEAQKVTLLSKDIKKSLDDKLQQASGALDRLKCILYLRDQYDEVLLPQVIQYFAMVGKDDHRFMDGLTWSSIQSQTMNESPTLFRDKLLVAWYNVAPQLSKAGLREIVSKLPNQSMARVVYFTQVLEVQNKHCDTFFQDIMLSHLIINHQSAKALGLTLTKTYSDWLELVALQLPPYVQSHVQQVQVASGVITSSTTTSTKEKKKRFVKNPQVKEEPSSSSTTIPNKDSPSSYTILTNVNDIKTYIAGTLDGVEVCLAADSMSNVTVVRPEFITRDTEANPTLSVNTQGGTVRIPTCKVTLSYCDKELPCTVGISSSLPKGVDVLVSRQDSITLGIPFVPPSAEVSSEVWLQELFEKNEQGVTPIQELEKPENMDMKASVDKKMDIALPKSLQNKMVQLQALPITSYINHEDAIFHIECTKSNLMIPTYPIKGADAKIVEAQIAKDLERGVLRKLEPHDEVKNISPLTVVHRQGSDPRVCLNAVFLNNHTVDVQNVIEDATSIIRQAAGNKIVSQLDLSKAYNQLRVTKDTSTLLRIRSPSGIYEYVRAPFGCKTLPSFFQNLLNNLFGHIENCLIFYDNLIVVSNTVEEHLKILDKVFDVMLKYTIRINVDKLQLFYTSLRVLGHIVDNGKVYADPDKVKAILKIPPPTTVKQSESYIGHINYLRNFIPGISDVTRDLILFVSKMKNEKKKSFTLSEEALVSFHKTNMSLARSIALAHPRKEERLYMYCDASQIAASAILVVERDGRLVIVDTFAKSFSCSMKKWSANKRESFAAYAGMLKFKHWLVGKPLVIRTDHRGLLVNGENLSDSQYFRWKVELVDIPFVIEYIPGELNVLADFISRHYSEDVVMEIKKEMFPIEKGVENHSYVMNHYEETDDDEMYIRGNDENLKVFDGVTYDLNIWEQNKKMYSMLGKNTIQRMMKEGRHPDELPDWFQKKFHLDLDSLMLSVRKENQHANLEDWETLSGIQSKGQRKNGENTTLVRNRRKVKQQKKVEAVTQYLSQFIRQTRFKEHILVNVVEIYHRYKEIFGYINLSYLFRALKKLKKSQIKPVVDTNVLLEELSSIENSVVSNVPQQRNTGARINRSINIVNEPSRRTTLQNTHEEFTIATGESRNDFVDTLSELMKVKCPPITAIFCKSGENPTEAAEAFARELGVGSDVLFMDRDNDIDSDELTSEQKQKWLDFVHIQTGHGARTKMLDRFKEIGVKWSGLREDVEATVENCHPCCAVNVGKRHYLPRLSNEADQPFQRIHVDIAEFDEENGYKYLLVLTDVFSGYVDIQPLTNKSGPAVALAMMYYFMRFGSPKEVLYDQGGEFMNASIVQLNAQSNIVGHATTVNYSESDGRVERNIGTIRRDAQKIAQRTKQPWYICASVAAQAINTTANVRTGQAPHTICFAKPNPSMFEIDVDSEEQSTDKWIDHWLRASTSYVRTLKKQILAYNKKVNKKFDKEALGSVLEVGDYCWIRNAKVKNSDPTWLGPYRVYKKEGTSFFLESPRGVKVGRHYPRKDLKHTKRTTDVKMIVKSIQSSRVEAGVTKYLVTFENYGRDVAEWVNSQTIEELRAEALRDRFNGMDAEEAVSSIATSVSQVSTEATVEQQI